MSPRSEHEREYFQQETAEAVAALRPSDYPIRAARDQYQEDDDEDEWDEEGDADDDDDEDDDDEDELNDN